MLKYTSSGSCSFSLRFVVLHFLEIKKTSNLYFQIPFSTTIRQSKKKVMSQVLYIDASNKLVGYLDDHHVERLLSTLFHQEEQVTGYTKISSQLFPLAVVIEEDGAENVGEWQNVLYCGKLYLLTANIKYSVCSAIPNDMQSLVQQTITQINAILALDRHLACKLRIFCAEIH